METKSNDETVKVAEIQAIAEELIENPLRWMQKVTCENVRLIEMLVRMIHSNAKLFASEGRVLRYTADSMNVPFETREFLSARAILTEVWETDSFNVKTRVVAYDIDWGRMEALLAHARQMERSDVAK